MKLGIENRKQTILAAVLGVVALLIIGYWFLPSSSTIASTTSSTADPLALPSAVARPPAHHGAGSAAGKKARPPQSLDPTLHLQQLASTEQIKYEGLGRNIFISQAEVVIPTPQAQAATDKGRKDPSAIYTPPTVAQQPPIPLKFFGFSNQPGAPRKVFLSKGDDVWIAGEGEIVDRRYKVVRISPTSVDIQDVVGSGPPQNLPLMQGNPS